MMRLVSPDACARVEPGESVKFVCIERIAVTTLALACAVRIGAQEKIEDRERAVLAVLGQLDASDQYWLDEPCFGHEENELGRPRLVPQRIICGNESTGLFDADRAKQLARELFAAYGLDAKPDCVLREDGVEVVLDGYDAQRRIGFKLRGVMPEPTGMWKPPIAEAPATDLTREELERLEAEGVRLDTADLIDYGNTITDEYTAMLAYLAGIVAFLDDVTDGPDVDLRAVLGENRLRLRITDMHGATEWREMPDGSGWYWFEVASRARELLCFEGSLDRAAVKPMPARLHVNLIGPHRDDVAIRVAQVRSDGSALECTSPGTTVLLPSSFDVTRRFTVVLRLDPGKYICEPW